MSLLRLVTFVSLISLCFGGLAYDMTYQYWTNPPAIPESAWPCMAGLVNGSASFLVWNGLDGENTHLVSWYALATKFGIKHIDIHFLVCPTWDSIVSIEDILTNASIPINTLWMEVRAQTACWHHSNQDNMDFVSKSVQKLSNLGYNMGIKTSTADWNSVINSNNDTLSDYPLWYVHRDNQPSFSDPTYYQFAGWTKPTMKEFKATTECITPINLDYYEDF
eukprot:gene18133-21669_t